MPWCHTPRASSCYRNSKQIASCLASQLVRSKAAVSRSSYYELVAVGKWGAVRSIICAILGLLTHFYCLESSRLNCKSTLFWLRERYCSCAGPGVALPHLGLSPLITERIRCLVPPTNSNAGSTAAAAGQHEQKQQQCTLRNPLSKPPGEYVLYWMQVGL